MSISKIKDIHISSKSQNQLSHKSLRNFKGSPTNEHDNGIPVVTKFSDNDLRYLSYVEPDKRFKEISKNTIKTLLVAIPIIDIVASGIVKRGNLSSKLSKSLGTAGEWSAIFATAVAVNGVKDLVNSKSEKLSKFDKNHGFAATLVDFAAMFIGFNALLASSKELFEYTKNSFPNFKKFISGSVLKPVKKFLNNSFVNNKIVKPAEEFVANRPSLAFANKLTASLLVPTLGIASLIRYTKELKHRNESANINYQILKYYNDFLPEKNS